MAVNYGIFENLLLKFGLNYKSVIYGCVKFYEIGPSRSPCYKAHMSATSRDSSSTLYKVHN